MPHDREPGICWNPGMTGRKEKHPGAAVPKNAVGADVGGTLQPQAIGNKWTAMGQSIWVVPRKVCLSSQFSGAEGFLFYPNSSKLPLDL